MTDFSPERCAGALLGARRVPRTVRRVLEPLSGAARPDTLQDGIMAQRVLARLCNVDIPAGFKIGATTTRMQDYLGVHGPIAGFMRRDDLHGSGSTLSYAPFLHPGVECELAVHLAHDLPPGRCSAEAASQAVDLVMAAIEVVENRYPDLTAFGTPTLVADQMFHAAAVLGAPTTEWRAMDLGAIQGTITVDGKECGTGTGAELLGHPWAALAWLASSPEVAAFGGLRAGQVVMLGSVTSPIWLDGPAEVEVRFDGLEPVSLTLA